MPPNFFQSWGHNDNGDTLKRIWENDLKQNRKAKKKKKLHLTLVLATVSLRIG